MGVLTTMRYWKFLFAAVGWLCLLAWLAAYRHGGSKRALDYAQAAIVTPLGPGEVLPASDQRRAMWSGWWSAERDGVRLSTSRSPDILFRWTHAAAACDLSIAAFPKLAPGQRAQPLYARINGAPFVGPVEVAADGTYRLRGVGAVGPELNVLTLWLPQAQRMHPKDERMLALGVRSVSLACDGDAPEA
jgi:hypothetical protein